MVTSAPISSASSGRRRIWSNRAGKSRVAGIGNGNKRRHRVDGETNPVAFFFFPDARRLPKARSDRVCNRCKAVYEGSIAGEDYVRGEARSSIRRYTWAHRLSQIGGLTPSNTSAPAPSGLRGRPGWRIGICRSRDTRSRCIASSPRAVAEARRSAHRSVSSRRLRCAPSPGGRAFGRGATWRVPHRSPRAKGRSVVRRR
jgi:hypothetical protein